MLSCSIRFSAPSLWMGGGLESRCVGRVYGADGAVRLTLHLPFVSASFPAVKFRTCNIYPFNVCDSLCNLRIYCQFNYAREVRHSIEKDAFLRVVTRF